MEQFSVDSRAIAIQADSEFRRRCYRQQKMTPLVSAEPTVPEDALRRPGWLAELEDQRHAFREELERREGLQVPDEDDDYQPVGEAWPAWRAQKEISCTAKR